MNITKYMSYACDDNHPVKIPKTWGKYAYVMLLMISDSYLPAALTCAYAIRNQKTRADLVIMVTNDIDENTRNQLKLFYDHVIEVPYIIPKYGKLKSDLLERYPHYNKTFTKINLFNLDYDKIVYMDIDSIPIKMFDALFDLNAPAAVYYGTPRFGESARMIENKWKPRLKGDEYEWHKRYCKCCGHGQKIPEGKTNVKVMMKDPGYAGITTELMVLKPDKVIFKDMLRIIESETGKEYFFKSDSFFFTQYFSGKWTGIDPRFLGFSGYPHPLLLFGVQNGGDAKPWLKTKDELMKFIKYNDFWVWCFYYLKMFKENKKLREYPKLKSLYKMIKEVWKSEIKTDINLYPVIKQFAKSIH